MRVRVHDWIVADGDVALPRIGTVLTGLGLRLRTSGRADGASHGETVEGTVTWHRLDDQDGLVESVLDVGTWPLIVESESGAPQASWQVGERRSGTGVLLGIAALEFDDFALPDVRNDWLVRHVARDDRTLDLDLDLVSAED